MTTALALILAYLLDPIPFITTDYITDYTAEDPA